MLRDLVILLDDSKHLLRKYHHSVVVLVFFRLIVHRHLGDRVHPSQLLQGNNILQGRLNCFLIRPQLFLHDRCIIAGDLRRDAARKLRDGNAGLVDLLALQVLQVALVVHVLAKELLKTLRDYVILTCTLALALVLLTLEVPDLAVDRLHVAAHERPLLL